MFHKENTTTVHTFFGRSFNRFRYATSSYSIGHTYMLRKTMFGEKSRIILLIATNLIDYDRIIGDNRIAEQYSFFFFPLSHSSPISSLKLQSAISLVVHTLFSRATMTRRVK